jgi:hypothetical protein
LTTALLCFLILLLGCVLWLALARAARRAQLAAAVWPDARASARYWLLIGALLVLALWFGVTLGTGDGVAGLLVTFTTPLLALTLVVVVLSLGQTSLRRWLVACARSACSPRSTCSSASRSGAAGALPWVLMGVLVDTAVASWAPSWLPKPTSNRLLAAYGGVTVVAVLVNIAVLPMAALYRDAFDLSAESVGRVRQLKLAEAMAQHRQGLREQARAIRHGAQLLKFQLESHWDDSGEIAFRKAARGTRTDRDGRPSDTPVAAAVTSAIRAGYPQFCQDGNTVRDASCPGAPAGTRRLGDLCALLTRHFTGALISALPV